MCLDGNFTQRSLRRSIVSVLDALLSQDRDHNVFVLFERVIDTFITNTPKFCELTATGSVTNQGDFRVAWK